MSGKNKHVTLVLLVEKEPSLDTYRRGIVVEKTTKIIDQVDHNLWDLVDEQPKTYFSHLIDKIDPDTTKLLGSFDDFLRLQKDKQNAHQSDLFEEGDDEDDADNPLDELILICEHNNPGDRARRAIVLPAGRDTRQYLEDDMWQVVAARHVSRHDELRALAKERKFVMLESIEEFLDYQRKAVSEGLIP